VDVSVGIGTEQDLPSVSVYPNPATNQFTVEIENPQDHSNIQLIDARGRIVVKELIYDKILINSKDLAAGVYLLEVKSEEGFYYRKKLLVNE
jgi:hypothetical protein